VPLALYVDWKNLYKRPANAGERLRAHLQEAEDVTTMRIRHLTNWRSPSKLGVKVGLHVVLG